MNILALESSAPQGSMCLVCGQKELVRNLDHHFGNILIPQVQAILQDAGLNPEQLDRIAVNQGPGSYTGLRLAWTFAQTLSVITKAEVIGICGLTALARETGQNRVAVASNARRGFVAGALFRQADQNWEPCGPIETVPPETWLENQPPDVPIAGEIIQSHAELLETSGRTILADFPGPPRASTLAAMALHAQARPDQGPLYVHPAVDMSRFRKKALRNPQQS